MKIRNMSRCAMLTVLLAVCAWISIPLGDRTVSMQTLGLFMALALLGGKLGTVTVGVYLLLGAAGVPVFAGFRGGIDVLLGPTGGYLWGFFAAGVLYWILERRLPDWVNMGLGLLICYGCGTVWYYFAYGSGALWPVVMTCVVPYLLPDLIKILLAVVLSRRLKKLVDQKSSEQGAKE